MAGPGDALFEALAEAKARPSKALRAVQSAGEAGEGIIGGYLGGKEIDQQLEQYRLLNTPLGSMYADPSQIPFGLSPSHTVKDLLTLAPAMENYVPSSIISGAAKSFGGNVSDGSVPPPPPLNTQSTPSPTPGTTDLNAIGGAGVGTQDNVPPGTPVPVPPPPSQAGGPTLNVPPGGMGLKGFQNVVLPALKAGQEERHFNETQANEDRRQAERLTAERNRTMAGETAKIAPSLTEAGTIQDDINALKPLFKGYAPIPFLGSTLASIASKSGTNTFGGQTIQTGKQIQQIVPALSAKVNYLLNKRFNSGEANMLQQQVVPNATDNEQSATQKIANLQRLVAVMQGGDINALRMVSSSIAGQPVNPVLPNSQGSINQKTNNVFASESDVPSNLPKGTIITVNGRRAVIR